LATSRVCWAGRAQPGCAFPGRVQGGGGFCQGRRTRGGIRSGTAKADEIYGAKFRELTYQADGKSYKEITEIAKDPKPEGGSAPVPAKLFPVSWLRCPRWPRFPNLTDSEWQWGAPDQIKTTIMGGRQGIMAAWGEILVRTG
jgi:cytochrome c oxidase cbb3-type subunit 3